jgi:hypothetical protein
MKNRYQTLLLALLIPLFGISQEVETKIFNGQTFQKIDGKYYFLDDIGQEHITLLG